MRSILFKLVFVCASILTGLICWPLSKLNAPRLIRPVFMFYGHVVIFAFRKIMNVRIQYSGRKNVPAAGSVIFAAKHQSYADSYSLWLEGLNAKFVLGKFTASKPIIRSIVPHLNMLTVDEMGGIKAFRDFKRQIDGLGQGEKRIVIYPEGEISEVGQRGRYHSGVYYLYKKFNCPVIPIATSMGTCWPMNRFKKSSGNVQVKYLPAICPGLSKSDFMDILEMAIETETQNLLN